MTFLHSSRYVLTALIAGCLFANITFSSEIEITLEDQVTGQIEPGLFGQFVELLRPGNAEAAADAGIDPQTGDFRPDVRSVLDQLALPVLRYPGGAVVEAPGWRWAQLVDGAYNITGDEKDKRVHAFGLDRFLDWSAEIESRPILVVKIADIARRIIPAEEVLQQARAMLAYVNGRDDDSLPEDLRVWARLREANGHPEPWGIRDWQLGNEFTWVAVGQLSKQGFDSEAISKAYVDAVAEVHQAMRALDPTIRFFVEIDMEQPRVDIPVSTALHERLQGDIEAMTVHKYYSWGIDTLQKNSVEQPITAMDETAFWYAAVSAPGTDERGQALLDIPMLQAANQLGYPLAITEWNWNSWWQLPNPDDIHPPNSLWAKGVAAASMLHGMMNAPGRISLATQSMLIGTDWDIRAIDASSTTARLHPSAQLTSLYGHHHGNERLAWSSHEPLPSYEQPWKLGQLEPNPHVALLDCIITRSDEAVYLHLINRKYDEPMELSLDTSAVLEDGVVQGTLYQLTASESADSPSAQLNEIAMTRKESAQWSLTLPPASVQVLELPSSTQKDF